MWDLVNFVFTAIGYILAFFALMIVIWVLQEIYDFAEHFVGHPSYKDKEKERKEREEKEKEIQKIKREIARLKEE